ncbi:MAG: hypothetical protein JNK53_05140, partial [Phycisphaerae bacterium]|nr:hypothetical protein [Phycisphaerae bacterium]
WLVMMSTGARGTIAAAAPLPATMHAVTARFAPPPAFQELGIVADGGTLWFPASAGSAHVTISQGDVAVQVEQVTNSIEAIAPPLRIKPNVPIASIARALLRRTPIELLDDDGVLVGRARVDDGPELTPPTRNRKFHIGVELPEPALRFETFRATKDGRTPIDSVDIPFESSGTLKGLNDVVAVAFVPPNLIEVTPETIADEVGAERARRAADVKQWDERIAAARTVKKRLEGISISNPALDAALQVIQASLTDDERKAVRGTHEIERQLQDQQALREVVPMYEARCMRALKLAQEGLRAVPSERAALPVVIAIDVTTLDGLRLYTLYPNGPPG